MKLLRGSVAPTTGLVLSSATGSLHSPGHVSHPRSASLPCPSPGVVLWLSTCRPGRTLASVLDTKPDCTSPDLLLAELAPVLTPTQTPSEDWSSSPRGWGRPQTAPGMGLARMAVQKRGRARPHPHVAMPSPTGMGNLGDTGFLGESWQSCSAQDTPCHSWNEFVGSQMGVATLSWSGLPAAGGQ